jgi:GT2 family glycosyltransferase
MQPSPLVSVIIVTWNSEKHLQTCLHKLSVQTFHDFETILVDNASIDGTLNRLHIKHSVLGLQTQRLNSNLGFAVANNIGVKLARGKWIVFLNADAFPEQDWLEKIIQAAETNPAYSFFSSRQIQANTPELLDGTGDVYHISGIAWRRHYNLFSDHFGFQAGEVFSACGAAALFSREDFLRAGGFDEDYFSYFEDVDLGFRLRLAGKKCLYVPDAIVHHVGSASTGKRSDFSVYYGYRNMIWTFFKNMPSPLIWFFLPVHIFTVLFFVLYLAFRGQGKVILHALVDAVHGLPDMLVKRKEIQRNITIRPLQLLEVMSTGLFDPYREFMNRNRKI